jgi:hypothetical protein
MTLSATVLLEFGPLWMWWTGRRTGTLSSRRHALKEPTMIRFTTPLTLRLAAGEQLAWNQAPVRARVIEGCAWFTRRGDLHDHFLRPGQWVLLRAGDAPLLGAEQEVWLRLEAAPAWRGQLLQALARLRRRLIGRASPAATVAG